MLRTIFLTLYGALALAAYAVLMYIWSKYYAGDWLFTPFIVLLGLRIAYVVGASTADFWFREK